MILVATEHTKPHGASFTKISRTCEISIKRCWYQVSVSVTTKPQGASFPGISRTCGLSIKRYWYQVSMSVTTKPQGVSLPRISRTCGLSFRRYWCKVSMSVRASSQNQQYNLINYQARKPNHSKKCCFVPLPGRQILGGLFCWWIDRTTLRNVASYQHYVAKYCFFSRSAFFVMLLKEGPSPSKKCFFVSLP